MTLNGVMAVTLRYFTEFGKVALQKTICGAIYARVYCILVRVQCRRKESLRSLSHLLMSFLFYCCKEEELVLLMFEKCPPHLNIVRTLPCENKTSHFILL